MQNTYQELWQKTKNHLANCYSETTFNDTFSKVNSVVKFQNNIIYVLVPNNYIKTKEEILWIEWF